MVDTILSYFPDAKVHGGYIRIRCPYHKDGNERRASMSILTEDRNNAPRGLCHCFACGKKVMINDLLKFIGAEPLPDFAASRQPHRERVSLTTTPLLYKQQVPFRFSEYLAGRGISRETQERFKIYEKDKKVHMPIFSREGVYLYDNARSTVGKRFFIEANANKSLWGLEEIDMTRPIAVCESQIDALSLWEVGVQAVATLGADNIYSLNAIKKCTGIIILAFDPDEAGLRARERAAKMLGAFRCRYIDLPEGIDINQALQDIKDKNKFKNFLNKCTKKFVQ